MIGLTSATRFMRRLPPLARGKSSIWTRNRSTRWERHQTFLISCIFVLNVSTSLGCTRAVWVGHLSRTHTVAVGHGGIKGAGHGWNVRHFLINFLHMLSGWPCVQLWRQIPTYSSFTLNCRRSLNGWRRPCSHPRSTCCPLITPTGSATLGRCPLTPAWSKSQWLSAVQHLTLR